MKTAGVIAEYDPFHNGHQYHLEETRKQSGADYCIAVMSGDFTQRGTPAMFDKYARAEMALRCGADLVLELPACYAAGSAEYFAQGAVTLLHKLGVVDLLSFGSECGSVEPLQQAAVSLAEEPEAYRLSLKTLLKEGLSFPSARAQALADCLPEEPAAKEAVSLLLSSPNNILGLEYCKALYRLGSRIRPLTVLRQGDGYHAESLDDGGLSSAGAIRRVLTAPAQEDLDFSLPQDHPNFRRPDMRRPSLIQAVPERLRRHVPAPVFSILERELPQGFWVTADDFSAMLHYKLLCEEGSGFCAYQDVSPSLSDRLCRRLPEFKSVTSFCSLLKTKELTHSRLSRALCHILTGLTAAQAAVWQDGGWIFYARILGFARRAEPLLSMIRQKSSIPLLSKPANAASVLDSFYQECGRPEKAEPARRMFAYDTFCSHLWEAAAQHKTGREFLRHEYRRRIIIPEQN